MKRLGVIFMTVTLDLIGFGMVVPMLPLYAQRFGATGSAAALLLAAYSLMQLLFAPLWGQLSDRVGRRPVLLTSVACNVLSLALFAAAPTYAWLLAARFLSGLCTANISVASAYVADVTAPEERARGMGIVGAAFGIGFVVGPFLGGELSAFGAWLPPACAAALSAVNFLLAAAFLPESLAPHQRRAAVGVWGARLQALRHGQAPGTLLSLIFLQVLGFAMMEMALALFVHVRVGFDAQHTGRLFAYVGVVLATVQGGLIGRLNRRFGEATLVRWGLATVALGLASIPAVPVGGAWPMLLGPLSLLAVGQGLCSPSLNSLLSRGAAAETQGTTLGLGQSVSALGRVVGPELAGVLFDAGGESWPFYCGALLVSMAWCLALARLP